MVELLEDLGYRGSVRAVPPRDFYNNSHEFQMAQAAWIADYPAASTFVIQLHTCGASLAPASGFCDPRIDAMIDDALAVQVEEPAASGALWAEIDREIVDQAPWVVLTNPQVVDFVSRRVGNYQFNPEWGVLVDQLWVR